MEGIYLSERNPVNVNTFMQSVKGAADSLAGELHLWQFDLERHRNIDLGGCNEIERRRAGLFAARRDGIAYLTSRVLLREVLGAYSGIPARELEFVLQDRRKPALKGCPLAFNISHSNMQLVIAIRCSGHVGVDIQQVKQVKELVLAGSVFAPSEVRFLASLPDRELQVQFFRLWVCREAVLKAVGVGFEGRGLALQRTSNGNFRVSPQLAMWSDIALTEFSGPERFLGALAWSTLEASPQIQHFLVR